MANIEPYGAPLMNKAEFEAATKDRRFSEENKEAARIVLCEGRTVAAVANEHGIPRQQLHRVVDGIYNAHLMANRYPPDWITATVVAPADELTKFKERLETLLRKERTKARRSAG
ncbi:TrfB-related DNA-binding protein [Burkholderia vietnamiensis]|uniref:TrfB-related DNA-binding protein n=1 Tax=Burkholderia vietnamiensis TaxID=60552 RepID=UPI0015947492|nr:TrfB-related DNA-binding protein [Burkholderia vietnamiensis]MCA8270373.1 transposase [Burkholderia vietnamiensis]